MPPKRLSIAPRTLVPDLSQPSMHDDMDLQDDSTNTMDDATTNNVSTDKKRKPSADPADLPDPKKSRGVSASSDSSSPSQIGPFSQIQVQKLGYKHQGPHAPTAVPSAEQGVYVDGNASTSAANIQPLVFLAAQDDNLDALMPIMYHQLGLARYYTGQMYQVDRNVNNQRKIRGSTETRTNLDVSVPPRSNINVIFDDIVEKLDKLKFKEACEPIAEQGIRVVTMCSGTESPLLALQLLQAAFLRKGEGLFNIEHLASAEIEPFKQAYIQRNFEPPILFRDVTDFSRSADPRTAYGGTAKIPEHVHLLVAGSSCIDYSSLNNAKKKFGAEGQSFSTLMGVVHYAEKVKPAVVILENVEGAPWKDIQKLWEKNGYYSVVMHLDTKDFYLPQTRNRGYMVAFEKDRAAQIGLDLVEAENTYIHALQRLAQRASSPYSDFLLTDDDMELVLARTGFKAPVFHNVDWKACRLRYFSFRILHKLGVKKPFTWWKSGGKSLFRDYGWISWALSQRERIFDTLDINFLQYLAERHYDMSYKSRWVELSQNVDRDLDSRHWGIVGCITPSGMPFDTLRGGPVSGKEALALQGIPVDSLILNKETSRQLQDLAGNAMSSTVIGSVIASAIIASCKNISTPDAVTGDAIVSMFEMVEPSQPGQQTKPQAIQPRLVLDRREILQHPRFGELKEKSIDPFDVQTSTSKLRQLAADTLPLCRCDDLVNMRDRSFSICRSCTHTACHVCRGNPAHDYVYIDPSRLQGRSDPRDFIREARKALPASLTMRLADGAQSYVSYVLDLAHDHNDHVMEPDNSQAKALETNDLQRYKTAINSAFESTTFLQSIKQDKTWRIIYESETAVIELQIGVDRHVDSSTDQVIWNVPGECVWLLYAKPNSLEPAAGIVRDLLSRPAARMKPMSENILEGDWEIWCPSMPYAYLDIEGKGQLQPSWEQNLGLQHEIFRNLESFSQLKISASPMKDSELDEDQEKILQSLCGDFTLLSSCEAACGSLYKRCGDRSAGQQPQYFFLDPKPQQNAYLDRMVLANTNHRLPYGITRQVTAELEKRWRPNSLTLNQTGALGPTRVLCRIVDRWSSLEELSFDFDTIHQQPKIWRPEFLTGTVQSCDTEAALLYCEVPSKLVTQPGWSIGKNYDIALLDKPAALKHFQWFLKQACTQLSHLGGDIVLTNGIPDCGSCSPKPPTNQWQCTVRTNASRAGTTGKTVITKPFEDALEASNYEKALRERSPALSAEAYVLQNETAFVIKLNLTTMVHRLCGRLDLSNKDYELLWRLLQYDYIEPCPPFPTLALRRGNDQDDQWPTNDTAYSNEQSATKPRGFARDLWPSQRRTLAWMLKVENGLEWKEWDAEIGNAPALNLQLVVEASTLVKVKGGIIADEVGAGKTTTSLALVARGLQNNTGLFASRAPPSAKTSIVSKATLILVPQNIIAQWQKEIKSCFGSNGVSLIVLKEKNNSRTIKELKDVDIILAPWTIFANSEYWSTLCNVTSAPFIPQKAGRAFQQWLGQALEDLENIVRGCGSDLDVKSFLQYRKDHHEQNMQRYKQFMAFQEKNYDKEQQKAFKKQAKKVIEETPVPGQINSDEAAAKTEFDNVYKWKPGKDIPALLHLFHFERVIVDEFTYLDPRALLAVQTLKTKHPWMLSGTPPLSNAECIDVMAKLIGTRISFQSDRNGGFTFKDVKAASEEQSKKTDDSQRDDKSYAEEFHEQVQLQSPTWLHARNVRSAEFAHSLIRQNPGPPASTPVVERFVVSYLSALEACVYNRCYQVLTGQPIRFGVKMAPKTTAKKTGGPGTVAVHNEYDLLRQTLEQTFSPEEALLSCTALCLNLYFDTQKQKSDKQALDNLVIAMEGRITATLDNLASLTQEAYWYWQQSCKLKGDSEENMPFMTTYLYCILNAAFEDPAVSDIMSRIAQCARAHPVQPCVLVPTKKDKDDKDGKDDSDDGDDGDDEDDDATRPAVTTAPKKPAELPNEAQARRNILQERSVELNEKTMSLVEQVRQLRLLRAIRSIDNGNIQLACGSCRLPLPTAILTLLGRCGHLVCNDCLSATKFDVFSCPVDGCEASTRGCRVPASFYQKEQGSKTPKNGTQMEAVVNQIKAINTSDSIIVFVQFEAHKKQLMAALTAGRVDFVDGTKSGKEVEKFQANTRGARVLVLKIDSADSAGWNLQRANHVMFLTPFLTKTRYDYESTMTQAIGRAHRYGQSKTVVVYHFLVARTLDVNVIQERRGVRLVSSGNDS